MRDTEHAVKTYCWSLTSREEQRKRRKLRRHSIKRTGFEDLSYEAVLKLRQRKIRQLTRLLDHGAYTVARVRKFAQEGMVSKFKRVEIIRLKYYLNHAVVRFEDGSVEKVEHRDLHVIVPWSYDIWDNPRRLYFSTASYYDNKFINKIIDEHPSMIITNKL